MWKRSERESAGPLPPKRRSEVTDLAIDLLDVLAREEQILAEIADMESRPLNPTAMLRRINEMKIKLLENRAALTLIAFKLRDLGAEITPKYPTSSYHQD